jgi:hypothetical protein
MCACCVDGDAGAPLNKQELKKIDEVLDEVMPYLDEVSKSEIERQGRYVRQGIWMVTPTINSKVLYMVSWIKWNCKMRNEQAITMESGWKTNQLPPFR